MKSLKEKFQDYLKKKSVFGKISDLIFIVFIVALFIPGSRLAISGFINSVKAKIIEPSIEKVSEERTVNFNEINWQLTNLEGSAVNFKDFKGKVIFLNFWATWCGPCIGEMPGIQKLYDKYKDNENIEFVIVSNENFSTVNSFIKKKGFTFTVYTSQYKNPEIFSSNSIPVTYIISKIGKIKVKETGAVNWGGKKTEGIINDLINK